MTMNELVQKIRDLDFAELSAIAEVVRVERVKRIRIPTKYRNMWISGQRTQAVLTFRKMYPECKLREALQKFKSL
jgi:hypothetical protein